MEALGVSSQKQLGISNYQLHSIFNKKKQSIHFTGLSNRWTSLQTCSLVSLQHIKIPKSSKRFISWIRGIEDDGYLKERNGEAFDWNWMLAMEEGRTALWVKLRRDVRFSWDGGATKMEAILHRRWISRNTKTSELPESKREWLVLLPFVIHVSFSYLLTMFSFFNTHRIWDLNIDVLILSSHSFNVNWLVSFSVVILKKHVYKIIYFIQPRTNLTIISRV